MNAVNPDQQTTASTSLHAAPRFGIGRKLLTAIILTSSLFALGAIAVQLSSEYSRESELLQRNLHQYFDATLPAMGQALWDADLNLLQQQLNGALSIPGLEGLQVTSIEGFHLAAGQPANQSDLLWELPIKHQGRHIGTLHAALSLEVIRAKLRRNLLIIVLTQGVKTLLMSLVILWLIHHLVSRYLIRAAQQLTRFESSLDHAPLNLRDRPSRHPDEVDVLEAAVNRLYRRLQRSMQDTVVLNAQLQRQSLALEHTVALKTASLQRQHQAAQLLNEQSMVLMGLSHNGAEQAVSGLLERAAQLDQSRALGFFLLQDGELQLVHMWPQQEHPQFQMFAEPPSATAAALPETGARGRHQILFPILLKGKAVALLNVEFVDYRDNITPSDTYFYYEQLARMLLSLNRRFANERQLEQMNRQLSDLNVDLQTQAETDALTGILNRRPFNRSLQRSLQLASRQGLAVGLLIVDIDHFKLYNDSLGHLKGDDAIIKVAQILSERFQRSSDMIARFGGEEFVALMTDVSLEGFRSMAETFRHLVWDSCIHHPVVADERLTVSVGGYWCVPLPGTLPRDLIRGADKALYRAKQEGRNRVHIEVADYQGPHPKARAKRPEN